MLVVLRVFFKISRRFKNQQPVFRSVTGPGQDSGSHPQGKLNHPHMICLRNDKVSELVKNDNHAEHQNRQNNRSDTHVSKLSLSPLHR